MMVNCHLKPFAKLGLPVICIGFFMVNFALPCWSQEAPVFSLPTSEAGFARAYNDGVQAYRQQDFGTSEKLFQVARASTSNDLAAKAYYNLGNSRFEIALAKGSEIDIKRLEAATEAYRTCLAIDRGFHDARYNLEAALRLILDQNKKKESQEKDPKKQELKENQESKRARQAGSRQAGARQAGARPAGTRQAGARQAGTRQAGTRQARRRQGTSGKGATGQAGPAERWRIIEAKK